MRMTLGSWRWMLPLLAVLSLAACHGSEEGAGAPGDEDSEAESVATADGDAEQGDDAEADSEREDTPADCLTDSACTRLMVAAHRGYHALYPDNTLAAVRAAFVLGADLAEVDVQSTSDGVLALSHESDLAKVTDGSGEISAHTWDEIKDLNVKGGVADAPESLHLALFSDALAVAREYGKMLYVDVKTSRMDRVVAVIRQAAYYKEALVREDVSGLQTALSLDERLLVMPPVSDTAAFDAVKAQLNPPIVEFSSLGADKDFGDYVRGHGVKIQQDVMALGDLAATADNDYGGWLDFVSAGVQLLQTDAPQRLVPAVRRYNETGIFPSSDANRK